MLCRYHTIRAIFYSRFRIIVAIYRVIMIIIISNEQWHHDHWIRMYIMKLLYGKLSIWCYRIRNMFGPHHIPMCIVFIIVAVQYNYVIYVYVTKWRLHSTDLTKFQFRVLQISKFEKTRSATEWRHYRIQVYRWCIVYDNIGVNKNNKYNNY